MQSDEECGPALDAMLKQFHRIQDNKAKLASAMHCFGKPLHTATNRSKAIRRAARLPGPMIACQPTAVARRTNKVGSKRRVTSGRPAKQTRDLEHPYCSDKTRRPARFGHHKLGDSVAMNSSHPK